MKITATRAALSIPAANAPALCVVDQTEVDAGAGAHTGCEDVHTAQLSVSLLTSDRTFHGFEKGSTTSYSYDETLVTVSSTGFVTANSVGKTGPVTITASVSPYAFTDSVTILVEKPSKIPVKACRQLGWKSFRQKCVGFAEFVPSYAQGVWCFCFVFPCK